MITPEQARTAAEIEKLRGEVDRLRDWLNETFNGAWNDEYNRGYNAALEKAAKVTEPLKICGPHLYLRFVTGDRLEDTLVQIGNCDEEGGCLDCDNDSFGIEWAQRQNEKWRLGV